MAERLRAVFYRGGTSKAVVFNGADLPADRATRDAIFLHVMGTPDAYGRQLNGMGGGLSSVSKVVIIEPSARDDADVNYTFVQIGVTEAVADYGSACGNMSSVVGPFAVDEGMVPVAPDATEALVRIYSTNMDQIYYSRFPVEKGKALEEGDFSIPGVSGTGAKIALDFLRPAGAATGKLLPSGNATDLIDVSGIGSVEVSMVDAANPVVFFRAEVVEKTATERPQDLDADQELMTKVEAIRRAGAVAMGMAPSLDAVKSSNPKVAMASAPQSFTALDGTEYKADTQDLNVRMVSMGNFHRAITLTGGMCTAVAAQIPGSLIHAIAKPNSTELRIGNPSGVLPTRADVEHGPNGINAIAAGTFRTQRRLMEGAVLYPSSLRGDAG